MFVSITLVSFVLIPNINLTTFCKIQNKMLLSHEDFQTRQ